MIKVSILVPIYNVEAYLRMCLDSLVNQTLREIEIICINDGSTDFSQTIVEEYQKKDDRIQLINKSNTGYGDSMNTGLLAAVGEYIGIVESDDFASPEMFEKLYHKAKEHEAEVIKSNFFEYQYQKGKEENKFTEILGKFPYGKPLTQLEIPRLYLVTAQIWSAIYKREFLEQNHICFHETPGASYQDASFAFQVYFFAKKITLVKEAYLHYRIDNPNSSVHSPAKLFCFCDEYAYIEEFLLKNPHSIEWNYIETAMKFNAYLWTYFRVAGKYQYAFLLRMKKELDTAAIKGMLQKKYFENYLSVWDAIHKIQENHDDFYDKTTKCCSDERIDEMTLNGMLYRKSIICEIKNSEKVILYGAGKIAAKVLEALLNHGIHSITTIMVTSHKDNPEQLHGIPVSTIEELEEHNKKALIVVAVRFQLQLDIVKDLKNRGFSNIIVIDRELMK